MAEWNIEPLTKAHERSQFSLLRQGTARPLPSDARQPVREAALGSDLRRGAAGRKGGARLLHPGFLGRLLHEPAGGGNEEVAAASGAGHPVPVILLARLAVDQSVQGQGLGGFLLADALRRCPALAEQLGVHAVEVDAMDEQAKAFSQKYGFTALLDDSLHLFLPMATLEEAFEEMEGG